MTRYNLQWLQRMAQQGNDVEYLFFWGHTNPHNEPVGLFVFSQWYPSPFALDGIAYNTAEHFMMAAKAKLFGDTAMFRQITQATTPKEAKALGRQVKGFVPEVWDEHCFQIVVEGNMHKFSQQAAFKEFLSGTNNKVIVEASPVDAVWGIGLAQSSKGARNPFNWRGKNLLGFALMQVRDLLQNK